MQESKGQVGKAGDVLPPFKSHMIRQRVTRHGVIFPLAPASELPGCTMPRELVGVVKEGTVKKWLKQKKEWDHRYASTKKKVHKKFVRDLVVGYEGFGDGELPPPSALAGRRKKGDKEVTGVAKRAKSLGLAMWSGWGSKHDKMTMDREEKAEKDGPAVEFTSADATEGEGARSFSEIGRQGTTAPTSPPGSPRSRSRRVTVRDQRQTEEDDVDENTSVAELLAKREDKEARKPVPLLLTPDYTPDVTVGSTGKRPYVDGIAAPFSIKKEADTASMMTLTSHITHGGGPASPRLSSSRPMTPNTLADRTSKDLGELEKRNSSVNGDHDEHAGKDVVPAHVDGATPAFQTPAMERPTLETFSTAAENLPKAKEPYSPSDVD